LVRTGAAPDRVDLALPEKYLLFVGRFIEVKNLTRLLEAFGRAGDDEVVRGWKLVLAGDGPLRGEIERAVQTEPLRGRVVLPGMVPTCNLPQLYARAAALILPSIVETWGLVVNEAAACGLPLAVSERCGCWPERGVPPIIFMKSNGFTGGEKLRYAFWYISNIVFMYLSMLS
jgi:glycosyltransferase involved in cell wall biosynthesis